MLGHASLPNTARVCLLHFLTKGSSSGRRTRPACVLYQIADANQAAKQAAVSKAAGSVMVSVVQR